MNKKHTAIITIFFFVFAVFAVSCSTTKGVPVASVADRSYNFDADKRYDVKLATDARVFGLKGKDLILSDGMLGMRFSKDGQFHFYNLDQVQYINERTFSKSKTTWAILGGVLGALVAGACIFGIALGHAMKE